MLLVFLGIRTRVTSLVLPLEEWEGARWSVWAHPSEWWDSWGQVSLFGNAQVAPSLPHGLDKDFPGEGRR